MKKRATGLSRAEWGVINICYAVGKATARQIYEASLGEHERQRDYQTVKTLLDRIAAKGFLKVEKVGPVCLFSPVVQRRRALAGAIDDFVRTVLDNSLAPLFQHLHGGRKLSKDEVESLKRLLQKREKGGH